MRFALVGLDSPHAPEFANLLAEHPELGNIVGAIHVPPSRDFHRSIGRVATFTDDLISQGIRVVESVKDLDVSPDAFLVTAVDPRIHLALITRLLEHGRPVFVHTRLVMNTAQAHEVFDHADSAGVVLHAASPKRFAAELDPALADIESDSVEISGPAPREHPLPPFHWYGVHLVDLAISVMGPGVARASVTQPSATTFRVNLEWADGREAVLHCDTEPSAQVSVRILRSGASQYFPVTTDRATHLALLRAIVGSIEAGKPLTDRAHAIEIVRVTDMVSHAMAGLSRSAAGAKGT